MTEGSLAPVACLQYEENDCPRKADCATLQIWEGLYKTVTDYLDGITLADIVNKLNDGGDYCI